MPTGAPPPQKRVPNAHSFVVVLGACGLFRGQVEWRLSGAVGSAACVVISLVGLHCKCVAGLSVFCGTQRLQNIASLCKTVT